MQLPTLARILAGIVSPVAVSIVALGLDQSGLVEIPWVGGAVVVMIVAGFLCGFLLRSPLASAYIFALWLVWAVVVLVTDDGRSDPPADATVLIMLPLLALPAALAALIGSLVSTAWMGRSRMRRNGNV